MKYIILFLIVALSCPTEILAQSKEDLNPCGTVSHRSDWLKNYQRNPHQYQAENDSLLYVPLTIHLVGSDEGTSYFSIKSLMIALCILNADFEEVNMQFFIEGDIRYLPNSAYNNHATILEGAEMMFANNVENTLNCYFVSDPAGNCGYNLPYAGMAVAKSCASPGDHTWSHEMGHALSLPHPFLGWEGGVSHDGTVDHSYDDPAPETVLYDYTFFKDTLILDTMIIDTAYVEKIDGSNCSYAADGFCDTAPDYLSFRWQCNADSLSIETQTDPNGEQFISDGKWIMSYSIDNCVDGFSDEQIMAMRTNLQEEKANVLYNQTAPDPLANAPNPLYPLDGELVPFDGIVLEWEPVQGAVAYYGTLYRVFNAILIPQQDFVTTNTFFDAKDVSVNKEYAWKVAAYSNYDFCPVYSEQPVFQAVDVSATHQIDGVTNFAIYPTLLEASSELNIRLDAQRAMDLDVRLVDMIGREVYEQAIVAFAGQNEFSIELKDLEAGVYFVGLEGAGGAMFEKVVVE